MGALHELHPQPVSYTHLDVYKRQYCATIETAQVKKDEVVFTGEIPARCIQAYRTDPVSYTHLYQHCKRRDRSYRGNYYRLRDPVDQKQDDRRTV